MNHPPAPVGSVCSNEIPRPFDVAWKPTTTGQPGKPLLIPDGADFSRDENGSESKALFMWGI